MGTKTPHDEGFTLVELLVVTVILAILIAIALLSYFSSTARARTITCEHNQRLLNEAVYIHQTQNGDLPTTIDDLEEYVVNFDEVITCAEGDGTMLEYSTTTEMVTCANH